MDQDITSILQRFREEPRKAIDELVPVVYEDLRRIARFHLRGERPEGTLNTTALVSEVYLRLAGQAQLTLENRVELFHLVSRLMRRVLVDAARQRLSSKRGNSPIKVEFEESWFVTEEKQEEWLAVDEALEKFTRLDPPRARTVEMRYFGGFTFQEIADQEGVSEASVRRDWSVARLWLRHALKGSKHGNSNLEQGL